MQTTDPDQDYPSGDRRTHVRRRVCRDRGADDGSLGRYGLRCAACMRAIPTRPSADDWAGEATTPRMPVPVTPRRATADETRRRNPCIQPGPPIALLAADGAS